MNWLKRIKARLFGYDLVYLQSHAVQGFAAWTDKVHAVEYLLGPKSPWPKSGDAIARDWSKISYATTTKPVTILKHVATYDLDDLDLDPTVYRRVVASLTTQGQFGMVIFNMIETHRRKRKTEHAADRVQVAPVNLSEGPVTAYRA